MLFSAINTSRFLLDNLRRLCPIFHICTFLHILDLSGRKRGAKGYVGPEFGYFVILTRDVCIEIDWYCIICKCKSL